MKTILLAACAAIAFAAPASACNVAVPGCQQWMYQQGQQMQRQLTQPSYIAPPPAPTTPSMSFGTINGAPFVVNRLGGWTDIQIGN